MLELIQPLHDHLDLIAGTIAAGTAVAMAFRAGRIFAWKFLKGIWFRIRFQDVTNRKLDQLVRMVSTMDGRQQAMEAEIRYNGGHSVKDMLSMLVNSRLQELMQAPKPILEMDEHGMASFANQAACRLFRTHNPADLLRGSWQRYLDGGEVRDFVEAFKGAAASFSLFRFRIRIWNGPEDRGEWEFSAGPIDSGKGSHRLYSGSWQPIDAVARDLAARADRE